MNSLAWCPLSLPTQILEKEMATHLTIFAWRIPWTEEPGRLQSMGSQIVTRTFIDNVLHLCGKFQLTQCFTSTISLNPENNFVRQVFLFLEDRLKITGLLSN